MGDPESVKRVSTTRIDGQEGHKVNVIERSEGCGERVPELLILQGRADEKFSDGRGSREVVDDAFRAHHVEFGGYVTTSPKIKDLEVRRRRCRAPQWIAEMGFR
jgi:hypothetical protein